MAGSRGNELSEYIRRNIKELKDICTGVDENITSLSPEGRWSPKEILSHLLGREGSGPSTTLHLFIDRETPTIDMKPEDPFFTENRAKMTFAQLLAAVEEEYERISRFAETLSGDQLDRKARVPMLKDSPLGEYPTLETWIAMLAGSNNSHVSFHTDHMCEILKELRP